MKKRWTTRSLIIIISLSLLLEFIDMGAMMGKMAVDYRRKINFIARELRPPKEWYPLPEENLPSSENKEEGTK